MVLRYQPQLPVPDSCARPFSAKTASVRSAAVEPSTSVSDVVSSQTWSWPESSLPITFTEPVTWPGSESPQAEKYQTTWSPSLRT